MTTGISFQDVLEKGGLAFGLENPTAAERLSGLRWEKNLNQIRQIQPALAGEISHLKPALEWVFARDGSLTGRNAEGWWSGCSVPLLSGRELLRTLELTGNVGCFLCPTHAGQLRACFGIILKNQGLIAIVPDLEVLAVILHCDDFSSELRDGRLVFAAGPLWGAELVRVFDNFPGLPMPQQFVRTVLMDDAELGKYTTEAQEIIVAAMSRRSDRVAVLRTVSETNTTRAGRIAVVAGSQLQLWNSAGPALAASLCDETGCGESSIFSRIDSDRPTQASPLAVAEAAAESDAIVTANVFRADFPGLVASRVAWITWVTSPRIAEPDMNCPGDGILLADAKWRDVARAAGWADERILLAGWPCAFALPSTEPRGLIALASDTKPLKVPQRVKDLSSQLLLWEMIENELGTNPFVMGVNPQRYLENRRMRMNLAEKGLDQDLFLEQLVLPAYHQGLARWMIKSGFAITLIGAGWEEIGEFEKYARGPAKTFDSLGAMLKDCGIVVHPSPLNWVHPIENLGLPVVQPAGRSPQFFAGAVRDALLGKAWIESSQIPPISRGRILSLVDGMNWPARPTTENGAD
ncbi:MAG: hypothetical protein M3O30_08395 [Planctomycetota bacterium]|nr:hypothetical protein [Planctomycetota bacterium]